MSTGTQVEVVMPQMGVSVSEGTVTRWLKQPGETIELDEPLLEISTDKVDTEVPSPGEGVVAEIRVQEGETVEVGTVLAVIAPEGTAPAEAPEAEPERPPTRRPRGGSRRARRRGRSGTAHRGTGARRACTPRHPSPPARRQATAARSSRPSSRASPPSTASTRPPSRAPARAAG